MSILNEIIKTVLDEQGSTLSNLTDEQLSWLATMPVAAGVQAEQAGGDPFHDSQLVLRVIKNIVHNDLHEKLFDYMQDAVKRSEVIY